MCILWTVSLDATVEGGKFCEFYKQWDKLKKRMIWRNRLKNELSIQLKCRSS